MGITLLDRLLQKCEENGSLRQELRSRVGEINKLHLELARLQSKLSASVPADGINDNELKVLIKAVTDHSRIGAIKSVQRMKGCGVKEAKDLVEEAWTSVVSKD